MEETPKEAAELTISAETGRLLAQTAPFWSQLQEDMTHLPPGTQLVSGQPLLLRDSAKECLLGDCQRQMLYDATYLWSRESLGGRWLWRKLFPE